MLRKEKQQEEQQVDDCFYSFFFFFLSLIHDLFFHCWLSIRFLCIAGSSF